MSGACRAAGREAGLAEQRDEPAEHAGGFHGVRERGRAKWLDLAHRAGIG